ncbi:hypothetical protein RZN05_05110 [Sphingomonas sp. HF-S4]|uniref:Uncharacterized protein n=1 Tax=Sphingomonas agrestis TaxID=3080540 RepID=A0ABU3Y584_9SPHN|nr:hypothetical protein [Sphingomonas sp. HF-S4]MDV3456353.1 hypothetical protein [Sphingomonas sp. HF-S4]
MQELGDELGNATSISPVEIRDRILDLFGQVRQESDRVTLLQMFNATMGVAVRHLEAKGEDTNGLLSAITADKRLLAIQESQIDGENVDPATLHYVVEREIAAGRMEPDSFQSRWPGLRCLVETPARLRRRRAFGAAFGVAETTYSGFGGKRAAVGSATFD